jgi:hypothetical protein
MKSADQNRFEHNSGVIDLVPKHRLSLIRGNWPNITWSVFSQVMIDVANNKLMFLRQPQSNMDL